MFTLVNTWHEAAGFEEIRMFARQPGGLTHDEL